MTKILNLARLDRKLKRLPDLVKSKIQTEMGKAADEIVGLMKRLAPVLAEEAQGRRPGALRDSIGWTWGKAPKGAGIVANVKSQLAGDLTITIYAGNAEAFYARWQEFGTQDMPASPYFYVSWRSGKKPALRQVRKAVRDAAKAMASS
ncbi:HK97 gp10 family phage protein [Rhizobium rhizogenes]|uniref:HK97-gp10 family putative phage morphogenesis protein n=1 Tax=Rhizobium rhizogenes TaxID=359 RepID=UPI003ECCCCE8